MENPNQLDKVTIKNREQLKAFFKNGMLPNENHFAILIDSMFIKKEDGISINEVDSLMIFPAGDEKKLLSFYDDIKGKKASWVIVNSKGDRKGLILKENDNEWPTIYFEKGGNIGIGIDYPRYKLEVDGLIGSKGRVGTYKEGRVQADGDWHDILDGLTGCHAYEIMAFAGKQGKGKYALLHATAISTFGKSRSKISKTCAHYGFWWNKINLRWVGETKNFGLQIKTLSNYGDGIEIYYRISVLWDSSFMNDIK